MSLAVSLVFAAVFAATLSKPLKKLPVIFYATALLVCIAGVYLTWNPNPNFVIRALAFAVQKGHVAFSFFTVVMFIGVFAQDSRVKQALNPVRAELSIIASILIFGHLVPYLISYLGFLGGVLSLRPSFIASFFIAIILLILLLLLAITSLNSIKRLMNAAVWKGIQRFSYLFYCLVFVHLIGFLIIPAMNGSTSALTNAIIYGVILVAYVVARLVRSHRDARRSVSESAPTSPAAQA